MRIGGVAGEQDAARGAVAGGLDEVAVVAAPGIGAQAGAPVVYLDGGDADGTGLQALAPAQFTDGAQRVARFIERSLE